jgi:outer membrane lipoprotein-sorting protein
MMPTRFAVPRMCTRALLPIGKRVALTGVLSCLAMSPALRAADGSTGQAQTAATLTAAQVVDRHVSARGGLDAWRSMQTLTLNGKIEAGSGDSVARSEHIARAGRAGNKGRRTQVAQGELAKQVQLPFVLEIKRPYKSRLEIEFAGKTAVQVYDGTSGWKVRPFLNRNEVEAFTADEAKTQASQPGFDGPLIDYAAKGATVELAGVEPVEGRNAYNLKVTTKSGQVQHVWIDTQTFLDVKVEGAPRQMDGRMRTVWVYQRDFRPVQGLMIPFVLETAVDGSRETHKMIIEKAALNPKLDDALFAKPRV